MSTKTAKSQAKLQAIRISKELDKFIKECECVMTVNMGVLEIHAYKVDSDGVKIYNHVIHNLTPQYKGRKTTAQNSKNAVKARARQNQLANSLLYES